MILFRFLKGYVCVAFTGDDLPRLIRICISRGIFLWDVKSQDPYHMQAMLYGNDVWKLHDILHKTKSKVRIQKKIGLPFLCTDTVTRLAMPWASSPCLPFFFMSQAISG